RAVSVAWSSLPARAAPASLPARSTSPPQPANASTTASIAADGIVQPRLARHRLACLAVIITLSLRAWPQSSPGPGRTCQNRPVTASGTPLASSLLALLDDITSVLDDVAQLTKVASKRTAGVVCGGVVLIAQRVSGVKPAGVLPVVGVVAKGALVNKAILVPAALAMTALEPWLKAQGFPLPMILPLRMAG